HPEDFRVPSAVERAGACLLGLGKLRILDACGHRLLDERLAARRHSRVGFPCGALHGRRRAALCLAGRCRVDVRGGPAGEGDRAAQDPGDVRRAAAADRPQGRSWSMTRFVVLGVVFLSPFLLSACSAENLPRGIYEGSRAYNKSIESTPLEKSKNELPPYDQFEKERRGGEAK